MLILFAGRKAQKESQCFIPEISGGHLTALIGVFVFLGLL